MGGNRLSQRQAWTHRVSSTNTSSNSSVSLAPSYFPRRLTTSNSKTAIFIEEVKPFRLNPEKVAFREPGEQRRGMEPRRTRRVSVPQGVPGPPPSVITRQPRPGRGVRGEAGGGEKEQTLRPARRGREGRGGRERRRGRGGGRDGDWGRGSRGRGALCEVWAGVDILTRGEGSGSGAGPPHTSAPASGGQERREGRTSPGPPPPRQARPAPSHRRPPSGRRTLQPEGERQEGEGGVHLAAATATAGAARRGGAPTDGVGSGMG